MEKWLYREAFELRKWIQYSVVRISFLPENKVFKARFKLLLFSSSTKTKLVFQVYSYNLQSHLASYRFFLLVWSIHLFDILRCRAAQKQRKRVYVVEMMKKGSAKIAGEGKKSHKNEFLLQIPFNLAAVGWNFSTSSDIFHHSQYS